MTSSPDNGTYRRFAYADPPYVGQSKRHYSKHPDYRGEVDHQALVDRLTTEFDGWALSASMRSLHYVLGLCPADVLVLAWMIPTPPPMGDNRMYAWEPLIMRPVRNPPIATRTILSARQVCGVEVIGDERHVIGEKSEAFCRWMFAAAGLRPSDEFIDLFPGSGAVRRHWAAWAAQGRLLDA